MRNLLIAFIDPYLAIYQRDLYENWKNEVDEVNIYVSGEQRFIVDFIAKLWGTKNKSYKLIPHGEALNKLYKKGGDVLITLDSDNFIYQKGVINKYASLIGEYDVIGSLNYMGDVTSFLSFWNKRITDSLKVDFRPRWIGGKYLDTMQIFSQQFAEKTKKLLAIPIDNLPEYEHLGRASALILACQSYPQFELTKSIHKSFNRPNRAKRIKEIFELTKDRFPFPDFNDYYSKALEQAR